jgi:Ca-activated chloride channel family protein
VILSDGEDHGGGLEEKIARLREEGVVVHAFGIGTPKGAPLPVPGGGFKHDEEGNVVMSRLHEDVLENMTRATGGSYTRVTSAALDPAAVARRIDSMEKRTVESQSVTTLEERFQWPLALATAALLFYLGVSPFAPREDHA